MYIYSSAPSGLRNAFNLTGHAADPVSSARKNAQGVIQPSIMAGWPPEGVK